MSSIAATISLTLKSPERTHNVLRLPLTFVTTFRLHDGQYTTAGWPWSTSFMSWYVPALGFETTGTAVGSGGAPFCNGSAAEGAGMAGKSGLGGLGPNGVGDDSLNKGV